MSENTLSVFDPNINLNSPVGSCLLKMLQAAQKRYELKLYTARTDFDGTGKIRIHKIPVPQRPVFLQNILFTLMSVCFYVLTPARLRGLTISTQGAVPFCHVCYAQNPHKLFLTRHRQSIGGGFFRRTARIFNYRWIAAMESIAFRRARVIVVPSQGMADELAEMYDPAVAAKLRVIVNPVDCKFFSPGENSAAHQARPFTFAFCALGNFEWKGLRLILEALATGIEAHLKVIGGTASEIREFQKLAESLGAGQQVTFTGLQRDIRPFLWSSDVFIFPSFYESFGLVCFQAAAAGLPLIATNLHALPHLLQHGFSGWRVERTVECIAEAMRVAVADRERTAAMGVNAKALAQAYDEPVFQERWLALLGSLG